MNYAAFDDIASAKAWRGQHGGYVFLADTGEAFWFSLKFTPTPIMLHPVIGHLSGVLNPA